MFLSTILYYNIAYTGRGAVWLARVTGGHEVAGSSPVAPNCKLLFHQGFQGEQGVRDAMVEDIGWSLKSFRRIAGPVASTQIQQYLIELFIRRRKQQVGLNSLNHEMRNLKAFLRWARKRNYLLIDIEVRQLPVPESERPRRRRHRWIARWVA